MRVTDQQVMKLLEEMRRHGQVGLASLRAGMDRKTGRKYVALNKLPSELKKRRTWRTHRNRFDADWPDIVEMLRAAPELEAKTLFEHLMEKTPGRYQPGQLRTLQRHIKQWRAAEGPPKEVFFPQNHRPGEAAQTDFTVVKEFEVRIGGEPFPHQLCHVVLPYSNWEWATPCVSESLVALRTGVPERAIMKQTGHKSTKMVRRYIHDGQLFSHNAAAAWGTLSSPLRYLRA